MSRPLRIEYPGGWSHVINRGRQREEIYQNEEDYRLFLSEPKMRKLYKNICSKLKVSQRQT